MQENSDCAYVFWHEGVLLCAIGQEAQTSLIDSLLIYPTRDAVTLWYELLDSYTDEVYPAVMDLMAACGAKNQKCNILVVNHRDPSDIYAICDDEILYDFLVDGK
jgi:hypothetical protein